MRTLVSLLYLAIMGVAHAAAPDYELYIQVCDRSHCQRAPSMTISADSQRANYRGQGVSLHIDTLTASQEAAEVRLSLDLVPKLFGAGMPGSLGIGAGKVSLQVEPRTLHQGHYSAIATFTNADKVYQVWGRLAAPTAATDAAVITASLH